MATLKLLPNAADLYATHAPFFESGVRFVSDKGNYACVLCGVDVTPNDAVGLSYTIGRGHWTHVACLRGVPNATLSTDNAAKKKARKAAQERAATERAAQRQDKQAQQTVDIDKLRAEIRAEVEKEYQEQIDSAVSLLEEMEQELNRLEKENETLRATTDKKAERRARLQKAS